MALLRTAVAIAVLLASFVAQAEKRVALVIGNSLYQTVAALTNPVRDAKAVAEALREAGFAEVTEGYDLSKPQFDEALKRFGDAASDADWALIFYAGHGIGIGGETYALPVDAMLKRAEHADDEAISLSRLRSKASGAKALRMVILDSCRENPFAARLARQTGAKRAISRGLPAPARPDADELIAYATRENDVADDGDGAHSPFTAAILQHLREPALEVRFLFGKVRDSVRAATDGQQTPTIYGDLGGAYFYFRPPRPEAQAPEPPSFEAAEAWRMVEHSESEAVLEAFIKQYGHTVYGKFARARLAEIQHIKIAAVTPAVEAQKPLPTKPVEKASKLYENAAQRLVRTFTAPVFVALSVAFSPDGRFAISGGAGLKLWNIASGGNLHSFSGDTHDVRSVAISPDGRVALAGSYNETLKLNTLKLSDIASGRELRSFKGHTDAVTTVAISPDGRTALSGSGDKTLKLWRIASGRELRRFMGHADTVLSAAFSPDGRVVLSGGSDKTLKLWDVASGRELRSFKGHTNSVYSVAFSPDGRTALSGGGELSQPVGELKLWDVESGRELCSFMGSGRVGSIAFVPGGRFALSSSNHETLKLWDIASGRELHSFTGDNGDVESVAVSPDGRFALSGGWGNMKL